MRSTGISEFYGWSEDDFDPIFPIDRAFIAKEGYRAWLQWLDAGRPEKYTTIYSKREASSS